MIARQLYQGQNDQAPSKRPALRMTTERFDRRRACLR
jgi:hypothetical protein